MKRWGYIQRRRPIKARNAERAAAKFERNFGERGAAVREMPCLVAAAVDPCEGPVQAAHTVARGMGGAKGDRRKLVPLCSKHHRKAGESRTHDRRVFEFCFAVDLAAEAARIAAELDAQGVP